MTSVSSTTLSRIALSGILSFQSSIDALANNVANLNSTAYKRGRVEFHELLSAAINQPPVQQNRQLGQAAGVHLVNTPRIFEQGVIKTSESPWDMAVEGEGFFQVQMPDGSISYTRDGTFRLDGDGNLINANGYFLLPGIVVPPDTEESFVNSDGSILVRRRGETQPEEIATITLARFANPTGLEITGDNLYQVTEASGPAEIQGPGINGMGIIVGSALESSNVDLSEEFVNMISAQRSYSLMVRALETSDEMTQLATQMR
jgi:flagellar basal-body rod protein FlgG